VAFSRKNANFHPSLREYFPSKPRVAMAKASLHSESFTPLAHAQAKRGLLQPPPPAGVDHLPKFSADVWRQADPYYEPGSPSGLGSGNGGGSGGCGSGGVPQAFRGGRTLAVVSVTGESELGSKSVFLVGSRPSNSSKSSSRKGNNNSNGNSASRPGGVATGGGTHDGLLFPGVEETSSSFPINAMYSSRDNQDGGFSQQQQQQTAARPTSSSSSNARPGGDPVMSRHQPGGSMSEHHARSRGEIAAPSVPWNNRASSLVSRHNEKLHSRQREYFFDSSGGKSKAGKGKSSRVGSGSSFSAPPEFQHNQRWRKAIANNAGVR
jgi:hypothetical protein